MSEELNFQKARGKALLTHFKKGAAFHQKMADHHANCVKAHEAASDHHQAMANDGDADDKSHHKTKAAFHKTMAAHHDKMHKAHTAHAEHHGAMHDAHAEDVGQTEQAKKAFEVLGIELEKVVPIVVAPAPVATTPAPVVATPAPVPVEKTTTGDPDMSKTAAELAVATAAAANQIPAADPDNPLQKQLSEGLNEALRNGLKEILASPEFRKTVQEQLGNVLINELGKQTLAPSSIKTFAVPRQGIDPAKTAMIAQGGTPKIDTTGIDPEFAGLVSMDN